MKNEIRKTTFGSEVEYFNGKEWKSISQYKKGEKVLTFFQDDKHAELLEPTSYIRINKDSKLNKFISSVYSFSINEDAEFLGDYMASDGNSFLSAFTLHYACSMDFNPFSHHKLYATFNYNTNTSSMLDNNRIRLMVMSIIKGEINDSNKCVIKTDNAKEMNMYNKYLTRARITDKNIVEKNGRYIIEYMLPRGKKLFLGNPLIFSKQELTIVIDEIEHWSSGNKVVPLQADCLDFLQMVYARYGLKTIVNKEKKILRKFQTAFTTITRNSCKVKHSKEKIQYSFTTKGGGIVLRNNGSIFVMSDYKK